MAARAFAVLGHRDPALFAALSARAKEVARTFTPQGIASLMWAFAHAEGDKKHAELFRVLAEGVPPQVHCTLFAHIA